MQTKQPYQDTIKAFSCIDYRPVTIINAEGEHEVDVLIQLTDGSLVQGFYDRERARWCAIIDELLDVVEPELLDVWSYNPILEKGD